MNRKDVYSIDINSPLRTDRRRMGAAASLFSKAADGRQGISEAGTQGDAEWHLLNRAKLSGMARLAEAVRTLENGIQAP